MQAHMHIHCLGYSGVNLATDLTSPRPTHGFHVDSLVNHLGRVKISLQNIEKHSD